MTQYIQENDGGETPAVTDVGVQSNSDLIIETQPRIGDYLQNIKSITLPNAKKNSKQTGVSKKEKLREGKTVPAVDFMDMNKTMINFNTRQEALASTVAEDTKDVSGGESSRRVRSPRLKVTGAFRHTEYAKGFYKVGEQTQKEPMGTSQKSSAEDKNNIGFSEIERSNVLENKD